MDRRQAERITSPALALVALISIALIAIYADRALYWLLPAPIIGGIGCLLGARVSVRFWPRGFAATVIFIVLALFWFGVAGYLIWIQRA